MKQLVKFEQSADLWKTNPLGPVVHMGSRLTPTQPQQSKVQNKPIVLIVYFYTLLCGGFCWFHKLIHEIGKSLCGGEWDFYMSCSKSQNI